VKEDVQPNSEPTLRELVNEVASMRNILLSAFLPDPGRKPIKAKKKSKKIRILTQRTRDLKK
jgi:hypothetical protein